MPRKKKTEQELEYERLVESMRHLLQDKHGRRVLWNILSECSIYSDTFTGNSTTFFMEGKRSIGLSIISLIEETDPTAYAKLLIEMNQKEETKEKKND